MAFKASFHPVEAENSFKEQPCELVHCDRGSIKMPHLC